MRIVFLCFLIVVSVFAISAQTHQQALEEFANLKQKVEAIKKESEGLEKIILQPDKDDLVVAAQENANVFRILPREKYDKDVFKVRGGGAFYSFTNQSHSYNDIPQLCLEQNFLHVGFYGANYGFIGDLGETPLRDVLKDSAGVQFLTIYKPATVEQQARREYRWLENYKTENITYKNRLPAVVGHSYVLRAISYNEADILVAFEIHRQDTDGSLIIFWKLLENFEKPILARK